MNIKKIIKLMNKELCKNVITIKYLNNRYYFRFHFDENQKYIAVRCDKLLTALKSKKTQTSPFGLGLHGNNKYLWITADIKQMTIYIANQKGGLTGNEVFYKFDFNKDLSLNELLEMTILFKTIEDEDKQCFLINDTENILK